MSSVEQIIPRSEKVAWTAWILLGIGLATNFFYTLSSASILLPFDEYKIAVAKSDFGSTLFFSWGVASVGLFVIRGIWRGL